MRTKLSVLAAVLAFAVAGTAKADTIQLIWQGSGTPTTSVLASSVITANIVVTVTSTNLNGLAWDIVWDDELAYVTSTTVVGPNGWNNATGLNTPGSSTGTSPGNQRVYAFDAGSPLGNMNLGTATVGTITFHVTGNLADGDTVPGTALGAGPAPGDVSPNFVNTQEGVGCFITQGGYCTGSVTVGGASVDVIPEPGTLALLALGVTGLGLVGRRSRS